MSESSDRLLIACALFAMAACAAPNQEQKKSGSELSVLSLTVTPPSLLVAKKSPRTAVIILDPAKAPRTMTIFVDGKDLGGRLTDADAFFARDLKRALGSYFTDVQVSAPGQPLPARPHVIVDVKMDHVDASPGKTIDSQGNQGYFGGGVALTWGVALRPSEAADYLYSFAGKSEGRWDTDGAVIYGSMLETAISELLKSYSDKNVHEKILALP